MTKEVLKGVETDLELEIHRSEKDKKYNTAYVQGLTEEARIALFSLGTDPDEIEEILGSSDLNEDQIQTARKARQTFKEFSEDPRNDHPLAGKVVKSFIAFGLEKFLSKPDAEDYRSSPYFFESADNLKNIGEGRQLHTNPNLPPNTSPGRVTLLEDGNLGLRDRLR